MPRAHGFIVDSIGNPVQGADVYFYRVLDAVAFNHRVLIDKTSTPVGSPVYSQPTEAEHRANGTIVKAQTLNEPNKRGYFDVPDGLPAGSYWVHVHVSGQQRWAWPLVVGGADETPQRIRLGGPGGVVIDPDPTPGLDRQFTKGTFTPSVSLYGLLAAPIDRAKRDLSRFRAAGFGNSRVWIDWDYFDVTGARALDRDGNFVEAVAVKLDELMAYGASIGMSFDLTMHAAGYNAHPKGGEGYDITEHKRGLRNLLTRWGQCPALRIVDVANEAEVRGQGGHGSPDTGHVSPGRFLELMTVARSVPRKCLVGVSISPGGDYEDVTKNYQAICRDTKPEILLPHFGRKSGWGAMEGPQGAALAKAFPGLLVHHQEPARNGHSTQPGMWPLSEFEAAFKTTQAAGSVGCCLHGDFGFDMRTKDAWDQRDAVEVQVCDSLKSWIS